MPKVTKQDKAILDMKNQRDNLKRYQTRIQVILDQEEQIAKESLIMGNKEKARRALRRRKYQETLLQQTESHLEQLEQLAATVEFARIEQSVLHGLKQGNEVLARIHEEMSIENVEKLMSETREAIAYQQEIDEMLSTRMTADEEEEVLKELDAIQLELAQSQLKLPTVPSTIPVVVEDVPVDVVSVPQPESREQPTEEGRIPVPA